MGNSALIVMIIGILFVGGYFLYLEGVLDPLLGGKKITCDVSVKNPLGFRAEIVSGPTCFTSDTAVIVPNTLALTDDNDIQLTLSAGGKSNSITDRIDEGKTKTYTITLRVDGNVNSGTLRLSDIDGDVETRNINI